MTYDPKEERDSRGRWGRMNSTSKAKLTASAQFSTKTKPGKSGKMPTLGKTSPRMIATPFKPSEPSTHAVAIQTAKNLDKDFHQAREKKQHAEMKAAIAKHQGVAIKYPPTKPKR
jgi:hypothetical protein